MRRCSFRSVYVIETTTLFRIPSVTKRCSPYDNRLSSAVTVGPSKMASASRKSIPCFLRFSFRLLSSQVITRIVYLHIVNTSNQANHLAARWGARRRRLPRAERRAPGARGRARTRHGLNLPEEPHGTGISGQCSRKEYAGEPLGEERFDVGEPIR